MRTQSQDPIVAQVPKHFHPILSDLASEIEQEYRGPNWMTFTDLEEFCHERELGGQILEEGQISEIVGEVFTQRTIAFGNWLGHWRSWYEPEVVFQRRTNR